MPCGRSADQLTDFGFEPNGATVVEGARRIAFAAHHPTRDAVSVSIPQIAGHVAYLARLDEQVGERAHGAALTVPPSSTITLVYLPE